MTENGLTEQNVPKSRRRTRRQLLFGGAAAAGVVAAEALGRAVPASAANGDPIVMGQSNQASLGTSIIRTTLSTAGNAAAVYGEVFTTHPGSLSAAVRGQNDGVGSNGVGVYGSHLGNGLGVFGTTFGGAGVFGTATTGTGVEGSGDTGVFGVSTSRHGTGVIAQNNSGGLALQVEGAAAFSRSGWRPCRPARRKSLTSWRSVPPASSWPRSRATLAGCTSGGSQSPPVRMARSPSTSARRSSPRRRWPGSR